MRTHLITLAAVLGLATPLWAGELDREFKGSDTKVPPAAPQAPSTSAGELASGTELDDESPTQAHRRWGWGVGYGRGWGGWGYGGWGYGGWHRPYYGYYGGWGWPSYGYRPYHSFYYPTYAYSYPLWSYASYGYPGWGHWYW